MGQVFFSTLFPLFDLSPSLFPCFNSFQSTFRLDTQKKILLSVGNSLTKIRIREALCAVWTSYEDLFVEYLGPNMYQLFLQCTDFWTTDGKIYEGSHGRLYISKYLSQKRSTNSSHSSVNTNDAAYFLGLSMVSFAISPSWTRSEVWFEA